MTSCRTLLAAGFLVILASSLAYGQSETSKPSLYPTEIEGKTPAQWKEELRHQDPSRREEAIRVITMFAPPVSSEVVDLLIARTHDQDISPKTRAVMALGLVEVKKEDLQRVIEALAHTLSQETQLVVRFEAAKGLARYGDHCQNQNVMKTLEAAVRERDNLSSWEIRRVCAIALIKAGKVKDKPADIGATGAIAYALTDPAAKVRMEAIMGLGYLGHCSDMAVQDEAEKRLVAFTHGSDKVLAMWSALSLMNMEYTDKKDRDRVIHIIVGNLKNSDVRVRTQAAHILAALGSEAKPFIKNLIEMLSDAEPSVKVTAIDALAALAPENPLALDAVVASLKNPDVNVRCEAVRALGSMPPGKAKNHIANLVAMLNDKEPVVKVTAIDALAALAQDAPPALNAIVVDGLKNPDVNVRCESVRVLGGMGDKAKNHVRDFIDMLSDKEPVVKGSAIEALAGLGPDARPALEALTRIKDSKESKDTDEVLRAAATFAIDQINPKPIKKP